MELISDWNPGVLLESPMFMPLHPVLARLDRHRFPGLADLNALLDACMPGITVASGWPLKFVSQDQLARTFAGHYEPRCYLSGELQTRANNWHDLFNALVWLTFPKAKSVINTRHFQGLIDLPDTSGRGPGRDMLTLFDESGVVVVYAEPGLASLIREFHWKELFWHRRSEVQQSMGFYLFGHGLYQKSLRPYIGMTGQGLLLPVKQEFFAYPLSLQLNHIDNRLYEYLSAPEHCRLTHELTPVPLLGIPGWSEGNCAPIFYDNGRYFRAGRLLLRK